MRLVHNVTRVVVHALLAASLLGVPEASYAAGRFDGSFTGKELSLELVQIGDQVCGTYFESFGTYIEHTTQGAVSGVVRGGYLYLNQCAAIDGSASAAGDAYVCDPPTRAEMADKNVQFFRRTTTGIDLMDSSQKTIRRNYLRHFGHADRSWRVLGDFEAPTFLKQCAVGRITR